MKTIFHSSAPPAQKRPGWQSAALIAAIFAVRLLFWWGWAALGVNETASETLYPDAAGYIAPARSLLTAGAFLNAEGAPEIVRTPGYPLLIAACQALFGSRWLAALITIQLFLSALASFTFIKTLEGLGVPKMARDMLGLIAVFNLHDVYFALFVLSDSLAQSLFMGFVYFLVSALKNREPRDFVLTFALLTLATFVRPGSLFLPFFVIAGILIFELRRGAPGKVIARILIAFILLVPFPIGAWAMRNRTAAGYFGFSAISDANLYFYHAAGVSAKLNGTDFYTAQEALKTDPAYLRNLETMIAPIAQRRAALPILSGSLPLYLALHVQGAAATLIYPGTFDLFRIVPRSLALIDSMKTAYLEHGLSPALLAALMTDPFGVLTLIDMLFLSLIAILTLRAILHAFRFRAADGSIRIALLGILIYNLIISAGPNGFGTYPRFRLSVSLLELLWIGVGTLIPRRSMRPGASPTPTPQTRSGPADPISAKP